MIVPEILQRRIRVPIIFSLCHAFLIVFPNYIQKWIFILCLIFLGMFISSFLTAAFANFCVSPSTVCICIFKMCFAHTFLVLSLPYPVYSNEFILIFPLVFPYKNPNNPVFSHPDKAASIHYLQWFLEVAVSYLLQSSIPQTMYCEKFDLPWIYPIPHFPDWRQSQYHMSQTKAALYWVGWLVLPSSI